MTTFSQLVDDVRTELLRPDLTASIRDYANQTIREMHFAPNNREMPILLGSNRFELEEVTTASPHLWTIPNFTRYQTVESIYAPARQVYLAKKGPSIAYDRGVNNFKSFNYWYQSGPVIAMSGVTVGETIAISYFEYPRRLLYYAEADRPATYDEATESYSYLEAYDVDDDSRALAVELSTNWVIQRWAETVKQGIRAKVWSRLGEDRARVAYSAFETNRLQFQGAESYDIERR